MNSNGKEETWHKVAQLVSSVTISKNQLINEGVGAIKVDANVTTQPRNLNYPVDGHERPEQPKEYRDFELYISHDGYVRAGSAEGERTTRISIDVPNNIQLTLELIEENITQEKLLQQFGKQLYELLFPNPIHVHLNQTEAVARSNQQKLRLRLNIGPDKLASLPWEFTYREEGGYFLAVNPGTVLSRYLNLPLPPTRVRRRAGPLHLLVIIANPIDQAPLDPNEWEHLITKALATPLSKQSLTIRMVKHATYEAIRDALVDNVRGRGAATPGRCPRCSVRD